MPDTNLEVNNNSSNHINNITNSIINNTITTTATINTTTTAILNNTLLNNTTIINNKEDIYVEHLINTFNTSASSIRNDTPFLYSFGNDITSILFLSLVSVFIIIISITLLNFIKSILLIKEYNEFKHRIKKYFIKYIEKIFFCFGLMIMVWYFIETIGLVDSMGWFFDESLLVNTINLNMADNRMHLPPQLQTNINRKTDKITLPLLMNSNKFINTSIQVIVILLIYYSQVYFNWLFQSIILYKFNSNSNSGSGIITSSTSSTSPISYISKQYIISFENIKTTNQVELEDDGIGGNGAHSPMNIKKFILKFQDDYIEPVIETMLEVPWSIILIGLLGCWLSIRLYLENYEIHSVSGIWAIDKILNSTTYISLAACCASFILFSFSILFLKYNNNTLKNTNKLNNYYNNQYHQQQQQQSIIKHSNSSNNNSNKTPNKKKKQVTFSTTASTKKDKKSPPPTSPIEQTTTTPSPTSPIKIKRKSNGRIEFDILGLIYILKIVTIVCAIICIILFNLSLSIKNDTSNNSYFDHTLPNVNNIVDINFNATNLNIEQPQPIQQPIEQQPQFNNTNDNNQTNSVNNTTTNTNINATIITNTTTKPSSQTSSNIKFIIGSPLSPLSTLSTISIFSFNNNRNQLFLINILILFVIIILNSMTMSILPLINHLCTINNLCSDYYISNNDIESLIGGNNNEEDHNENEEINNIGHNNNNSNEDGATSSSSSSSKILKNHISPIKTD